MSKPRLAGVIGHPVRHSKSPLIQNAWLKRHSVEGLYIPLDVAEDRFRDVLALAPELGFVGFNVTIPHKIAAYELAEIRTARAARARSVNTLWWDQDGKLCGDSSDGFGFLENLRQRAPDLQFENARVVLLGAGGAAAAVAAALLEAGVASLKIFNRTIEKAEALADLDPERVAPAPWPPSAADLAAADLLVNGTSLGMKGQPSLELDWPNLAPTTVATDMIYAPLDTPFLIAAKSAGATTVDGLGMLLHQARAGFQRWFGPDPEVDDDLRRLILDKTGYLP